MSELETPSVRIKALERENIALKALATGSEENAILRRQGLENGSTGVKAAFYLIAFIFVVSVVFEFHTGKPLQAAPNLIGLGAILCVALVAYFGFIFKYTVSAELSNDKMVVVTALAAKGNE